ncbi:putative transcription factor interactor and regulator CCHC(Zn) family [Helianthus debilis subsp. tardiflorus]
MYSLRDTLRQLTKGTSSVTDYSRKFKSICDQLAAIGQPVLELDKFHWFLCGLGPAFENFSVAIRTTKPALLFRDLVTQAESHEIFMQSIHGSSNPPAAFTAQHQSNNYRGNTSRGRSNNYRGNSYRGGQSNGRGRSYEKRLPHCQICKTHGHSATACPDLHKYARQHSPSDESLAKAFHAQCYVTNNTPDWNADSGATAHMTPDFDSLHQSAPYQGSDNKKSAS